MTTTATVKKRHAFSAVPDAVLEHPRLSHFARLTLAWMLGRPAGWVIRIAHMTSVLGLTHRTWPRIRKELIAEGFFVQRREKLDNGKFVWTQEVSDEPLYSITTFGGDGSTIPTKRMDAIGSDASRGDIAREVHQEKKAAVKANDNAAKPTSEKQYRPIHGVECWYEHEPQHVLELVEQHGVEAVEAVASDLSAAGIRPLYSRVTRGLNERKRRAQAEVVSRHLEAVKRAGDQALLATATTPEFQNSPIGKRLQRLKEAGHLPCNDH